MSKRSLGRGERARGGGGVDQKLSDIHGNERLQKKKSHQNAGKVREG